jgi:hypothetical protein
VDEDFDGRVWGRQQEQEEACLSDGCAGIALSASLSSSVADVIIARDPNRPLARLPGEFFVGGLERPLVS